MKKIFALGFGILMLASCSSDDGGSSVNESQLTNKKWYYSKYVIEGVAMDYEHENIQCGKDYSLFKRELFQNLTELNPDINQLELFKKSQKLIDRFLFLFFVSFSSFMYVSSLR